MKPVSLLVLLQLPFCSAFAQQFAVAADKENVFYIGVDNPITVAAENCPCKSLVVKTDNGKIDGTGCKLIYKGNTPGAAYIRIYKKTGEKLKQIGSSAFRVKRIPPPTFKIGSYGYSRKAQKVALKSQQYVRAELDGFDFQAMFRIDSFYVKIFFGDSCKQKTYFNRSNKISQEIIDAFSALKKDDIVIFDKIFVKAPDDHEWELDPLLLTIEN